MHDNVMDIHYNEQGYMESVDLIVDGQATHFVVKFQDDCKEYGRLVLTKLGLEK